MKWVMRGDEKNIKRNGWNGGRKKKRVEPSKIDDVIVGEEGDCLSCPASPACAAWLW